MRAIQLILVMIMLLSAATLAEASNAEQILLDVKTLAGNGSYGEEEGDALSASFRHPSGITLFENDTLLISDSKNHLIRLIDGDNVTIFAGSTLLLDEAGLPQGTLFDGAKEIAMFNEPYGIAVDQKGTVFVADRENHAIRQITADGEVSTVAGDGIIGNQDGQGEDARFFAPSDVVVDAVGNLYVADTLNHVIRKITPDGEVSTLTAPSDRAIEITPGEIAESGDHQDGSIAEAKFNEPSALALDQKGNLYVADSGNHVIRYLNFEKNTVRTVAGNPEITYAENELYAEGGFRDGNAMQAQFHFPKGIAYTESGGLVITDSLNHAVRVLKDGTVTTLVGNSPGDTDSIETFAQLHMPYDVAVDGNKIYVADAYNNKIRVFSLFEYPEEMTFGSNIQVLYHNELLSFDQPPLIRNNRTMIPVRAVAETLGYQVDQKGKSITLAKNNAAITLTIGEKTMQLGDSASEKIDVAPFVENNRTYVPLRFLSEGLDLDVQWNQEKKTVILREK